MCVFRWKDVKANSRLVAYHINNDVQFFSFVRSKKVAGYVLCFCQGGRWTASRFNTKSIASMFAFDCVCLMRYFGCVLSVLLRFLFFCIFIAVNVCYVFRVLEAPINALLIRVLFCWWTPSANLQSQFFFQLLGTSSPLLIEFWYCFNLLWKSTKCCPANTILFVLLRACVWSFDCSKGGDEHSDRWVEKTFVVAEEQFPCLRRRVPVRLPRALFFLSLTPGSCMRLAGKKKRRK